MKAAGKKPAKKDKPKTNTPAAKPAKEAPEKAEEVKEAPAASLVHIQGDDIAPITFRDKSKCLHTYTSPRKVEDFGLDQDADCPGDT